MRTGWRPSLQTSSRRRRRPVAVAVTGGIGAGKTETLRAFERRGAAVISTDEIVHALLREDAEVKAAVVDRFGERVLGDDGEIDRRRVADVVFSDPAELGWLEALLHPRVLARYVRWREELEAQPDPPAVCVAEVPLLYEAGADDRFDFVVAVAAPRELRTRRRGKSLGVRERRLIPEEEKASRADFAYVNDGSLGDLDAFVARVLDRVTSA